VPPPACEGDACQSPAQAPGDPTLSSSVSSGPGNPSGGFRKPRHRKPHQKHRHRKRAAQHNRGGAK
jgi:hypothetical protein